MPRATLLLIIILAVFAAPVCYAQAASSTSYRLTYSSFSSSGGAAASPSYQVTDCLASESAAGGLSKSQSYVLYAACAAAVPAFLQADDYDGDGVPSGVEDGAPNNGDSNNDGIQDSVQSQVVSLPSADGNGYKTVEACGDALCTNVCKVNSVRDLLEEDLPQQSDDYEFPNGLLEFTLDCSPVDIRILYHDEDWFPEYFEYVNFGPDPPDALQGQFYIFPGAVFGSDAIPGDNKVASVRFRLEDGAQGDDTGVDGSISTRGGPALSIPVPIPAMGLAGLLMTIFIMFFMSFVVLRRVAGFANKH